MSALCLTRKLGTAIQLTVGNEKIKVTYWQSKGKSVRLRVECDPSIRIDRINQNGDIEKPQQ